MSCGGRFLKVEGGILPAVSNYDYPDTNLYVRGIQDLSFRFQEVHSQSTWLFQEKSHNASLEITTGSFIAGTEKDITDRALTYSTLYSGWVASGTYIYDIPLSGAGQGGSYKTIESLTGTFYTQSRIGDHSALLVDASGNSVSLTQTGLTLGTGQKHQLFGMFQEVYAGTGVRIDFLVEGYTGSDPTLDSNIVAYYDHTSLAWTATRPSNTHPVTNRPTELRYDFTTSAFPGVIPSGYNIKIALTGSDTRTTDDSDAAFIQVDAIYVDQYMQKNAFTDIVLPTGYLLQITPDIGWHDTLAMFGERESTPNPHLVTLGPYTLQSGMVDNQDGSVTITVDSNEMDKAVSTNYRKYLWRSIAFSANGNIGEGGFPRRFSYLGKIFDEEFSVTRVWNDSLSITKLITGTKSNRMRILVDGEENHPGLEYPTETSWKLTIVLDSPTREISVQGKDKGGALTSIQYIDLACEVIGLTEKALWNVFDEHGLLLGVDRLPGECNEDYADRIKDAFTNPGTHFFKGVTDGGTRELGLTRIDNAITISLLESVVNNSLSIDITSSSVLVRTSDLVITDTVVIDPVFLTCDLTEHIADDPIVVELVDGNRVNLEQIIVSDERSERPDFKRLQFTDDTLGGKVAKVRYEYYREYKFIDYPSLGDLVIALRGFTDSVDSKILTVSLNESLAGHESSFGLYLANSSISAGSSFSAGWSPMNLKSIGDRVYRESFRNADGTLWNTKFYKWVTELKSNTNIEWGHVIADKAFWDAADNKLDGFDHLPTLADPAIVKYATTGGRLIDGEEAQSRGYVDENGDKFASKLLRSKDFLPGVAYTHDLEPDIFGMISNSPEIADVPDTVVGETGNSPIKFFTGNIN